MTKNLIPTKRFSAPPDSRLDEFGLDMPAPTFRATALSRSAADVYTGIKTYSREQLFALIEAEHGTLEDIAPEKLGYWRAVVSNSSLDSYFTRMAKNSLMNYAADASSPTVSFQNSHRHNELPVGRSVIGQYIETGNVPQGANADDYFPAVIVDFYSHRDLQLGSVSVEQFLLGIKSHVAKDVSIGFKEGVGFQYTCSVCRENYFSWDCRHIAGVEYGVGDDGDPSDDDGAQKRMCFVWVENARLSEVSAVYDGATTNAMIIKAERESRAGRLDVRTANFLERRFRFRAEKNEQFSGVGDKRDPKTEDQQGGNPPKSNNKREENSNMSTENNGGGNNAAATDLTPKIRAFARELGFEIKDDQSVESVFETVRGAFNSHKTDAAKFNDLRKAEIEIAVGERIRAEGGATEFGEEKQKAVRSMLENCAIEGVKEFAGEWRKAGDARFGKGRQSGDNPENDLPDEGGNERGADGKGGDADRDKDKDATPQIFRTVPMGAFRGGV